MELTIEEALQQAVAAHKEGKLQGAERLYRAILESHPLHPDANHNLGILLASLNKTDAALPLFKTALEANPKIEQFWLSYIHVLIKEKQFDNAKKALGQAKKHNMEGDKLNALKAQLASINKPENITSAGPSQQQLSSLLDHYQKGRLDDAEKLAISLTHKFSQHQFAWKVLGAIFKQTGRINESLVASQKSVQLAPQDAEAHSNMGVSLQELGRLDEAKESYRKAIALKPDHAEAHNNMGYTLQQLGRLDEAKESYTQAIALKPDYAEAHNNLGNTLHELGKLDESIELYTKALASQPNNAEFLHNLSTAKGKAVPSWHIPMMNEHGRNEAYQKAMRAAIRGGDVVLDIGTGAGLLSMIAADCGASEIITCEMSTTISKIAEKIIQKNGFDHKIKVINKNSKDLILGQDINKKVDILVSEILSSEFVGEGIQTTVLDAKKRLLKKTGKMIPEGGSIMIALIENTGKLAKEIFVDRALGYDIGDFNSITNNKLAVTLEDEPEFLSNPIEAFTFDFCNFEKIYRDTKTIKIEVNRTGVCAGVIQWLKVQLYDDIEYQNNPVEMYRSNSVSGWKPMIFRFNDPINVTKGQSLNIQATLTEDYSWFDLDHR